MRVSTILHEVSFWAISGLLVAFAINNGYFAGRVAEQNVWPVTYLMVQAVEGSALLFFYIVATLYAAELVWRERDVHADGIHDSLPMPEMVDWLSKLAAIAVVELILLTLTMFCGVFMQTLAGYYRYEFLQYFKELYIVTFPQVMTFALLALFVQTVVSNKFIGHGIALGVFVITPDSFQFRLGEYALPVRLHPAVHLQRLEWLRTLRAGAVLVHYVLAGDCRISGCAVYRADEARLG